MTRMAGGGGDTPAMSPELVAPMAAYLAHEACPVTGEIYAAGAGRFARIFIATTPGYVHPGQVRPIEDVADHWAEINDEAGYSVPADLRAGRPPSWRICSPGRCRPSRLISATGSLVRADPAPRPR